MSCKRPDKQQTQYQDMEEVIMEEKKTFLTTYKKMVIYHLVRRDNNMKGNKSKQV
ncbi:4537_t:CDS:2 [Acaulospora morrowiae]|uniref:4537_t:CDS:1 n=1 Tax=Acaulospora morrowiae TaxID=94023 RepID=A0A9N8Z1C1_9GLOM|nr:4537_t:CDS:2 [Acaulospora morrowiae]